MILPEGTIKRIHVNKHKIASNRVHGRREPVFTIKNRGKTYVAEEVEIAGPARFIYSPECPLACGAVAWVECTSEVRIISKE
jgi:hypothetical protein